MTGCVTVPQSHIVAHSPQPQRRLIGNEDVRLSRPVTFAAEQEGVRAGMVVVVGGVQMDSWGRMGSLSTRVLLCSNPPTTPPILSLSLLQQ